MSSRAKLWPAIRNYAELKSALNERRIELKMTMLELDELAGLQQGYSGKLFSMAASSRNFGPISLGNVLKALGVELVILPTQPGKRRAFKIIGVRDKLRLNRMAIYGRRGGLAAKMKATPEEWRQFCRAGQMAMIRKRQKRKSVAK